MCGLGCNDFTVKCAVSVIEKNGGYEKHHTPALAVLSMKDGQHKIPLCEQHVIELLPKTLKNWKLFPIQGKELPEFAVALNKEFGHSE